MLNGQTFKTMNLWVGPHPSVLTKTQSDFRSKKCMKLGILKNFQINLIRIIFVFTNFNIKMDQQWSVAFICSFSLQSLLWFRKSQQRTTLGIIVVAVCSSVIKQICHFSIQRTLTVTLSFPFVNDHKRVDLFAYSKSD